MTSVESLNKRLAKAVERKEKARARAFAAGMEQRELADRIARLEQQQGDDEAIEALRARGGTDGAVAARTIAATMPDPDRTARFEDLAGELMDG